MSDGVSMNEELALETDPIVKDTDKLKAMMRARFCAPEWALFFEVYASTGYAAGGRSDAVAMNLYPSRGLSVNGFELKVSRADWLKELKDGAKAETIFGYCDHWWLVVGDRSIVKPNELPEPWGLIAPRKRNGEDAYELAIVKQAPKLSPQALDRAFLAVLVRRAHTSLKEELQPIIDAANEQVRVEAKKRWERDRKYMQEQHADLKREVEAFEEASGVRISNYSGGKELGDAVAVVRRGGLTQHAETFRWMLDRAQRLTDDLKAIEPLLPEKTK